MSRLKHQPTPSQRLSPEDRASFLRMGILPHEDVELLRASSAGDIFATLQNQMSRYGALCSMGNFERLDTFHLLTKLYTDSAWVRERSQIEFQVRRLTHIPEVHDEAVDFLRGIKHPFAIDVNEKRTIAMAKTADAPLVRTLDSTVRQKMSEPDLLDFISKGDVFYVLNPDGQIVSLALANHLVDTHELYLNYIFTDQGKRRDGFGKTLIEYLLRYHASIKCTLHSEGDLSPTMLKNLGFRLSSNGTSTWVWQPKLG